MSRLDELYDEYRRRGTAQRDADISASDKVYDTEKKLTTDTYNRQINDTSKSYENYYDENAVQKLINEREIAENMANSGLTDSGLNRTQQTAVQLSYANNKNRIDMTRQKAIDTLTASLADAITKLDTEKLSAAEKIRSSYDSSWNSAAHQTYATELEEETKRQKQAYDYSIKMYEKQQAAYQKQLEAQKQASYIIPTNGSTLRRNFSGSLKDNGVSVIYNKSNSDSSKWTTTYVDNNSGKKTEVSYTTNPYTGTDNSKLVEKYGAFDNGYQYRGVDGHGKLIKSVGKDEINGNMQNIFQAADGTLWIWDGSINEYRSVDINGDGVSNIKDLVALRKK